ncbi:zinc-binding dehydrogenase [Tahibacter amnicola]|uniref:Zinc-binding dehydrogenase n=1 Tax=Tahibacter amnicola TaxID=2976241 RepID=A0ABY6BAV5_9GAMM|nr:zinc-binding dehydrogenase [Tahibacter amnicola]UXI66667.1 zinc-binding dehydrogenase [Tahibacter amnicola]
MRCIVIDRPGGYDALKLVEKPDPVPGPGEVLIAVSAAGVNYADGIIRMGLYESAKRLHGYPITPGFEVAGTIAGVGPDVHDYALGDRVIALTLFGGYTDRLCVNTDRVFRLPTHMDFVHGAALPAVFLTAWFLVHELIHPRRGDTWLVHSAAGGVGSALAQLGNAAGCRVVGVVGNTHKRAAAIGAGCDAVIDKSMENLWQRARAFAPEGYQAVFDANGVSTLRASYGHLAPAGKLAIYGFASMLPRNGRINWLRLAWDWLRTPRFNPLKMTQDNRSVVAANLSFLTQQSERLRTGMEWLLARFENGELIAPPVSTFPLGAAASAQRAIESGSTVGKLVLVCETPRGDAQA